MPETVECISSGLQAQNAFSAAKATGSSFNLEAIVVDSTKREARAAGAPAAAKQGLVYELDSCSTIKRGQKDNQSDVYPPALRTTASNPDPPSVNTLTLEAISYTNRALILNFGTLFFMLQYLTHTSVQFYPRHVWERSIRNVSKEVRKFSIGVAFVFHDYVLAFPTLDLLFQPTWAASFSDFSIPPNIYTSTNDFLSLVATWIDGILRTPVHTRACDTIRGLNTLFYGVGVYTVMELFFMAGLSPFLTLYEVFSNPSRAARFLLAFYSYIARAERDLWKTIVQSAIHDGILAPTTDQRLRYGDWLYIWAKDKTLMPLRMACLVDEYHAKLDELSCAEAAWSQDAENQLFDVFEPTFLALGFQSPLSLGHLIFGADDWVQLGGTPCSHEDPITAVYRKHGLLGSPTRLKFDPSESLILPHEQFRGKRSSYRPTRPAAARSVQGAEHHECLFKNIVATTLGVSIGPLEYCGVGHIVHVGPAPYVAVCKGDPAISEYHEKRALRGLDRISAHLETAGKRKRARSLKENKQLAKKLSKLDAGYHRVGAGAVEDAEGTEPQPSKPKKRRLSADQRLALATIN
ncbi:hypothetical protein B0H16DRAFT_1701414 [Mycena metata]|uniref:Uncharacterized protein n=1 Tax=Mycena metata TaxID=1033252 RepID=A0AAD7HAH1_9AGAR|nr:hypothetical protein B0H16DRAFT_1701414 [Mycena metata]